MKDQDGRTIRVYVPSQTGIGALGGMLAAGSAVVATGELSETGLLDCYFEGNLYDAENLREFSQRAVCAAGRLVARYPTVARSRLQPGWLVEVGTIEEVTDPMPPQLHHLPPQLREQFAPRPEWRFVPSGHGRREFEAWVRS